MISTLNVIELSKDYDGKSAVKNISFEVNQNEIVGILGPNGCGNYYNRNDFRIIKTNKR